MARRFTVQPGPVMQPDIHGVIRRAAERGWDVVEIDGRHRRIVSGRPYLSRDFALQVAADETRDAAAIDRRAGRRTAA